ncbi:hypothetical protein CsSME_00006757 [Camellia sinensis var. sinensis]
MTGRGLRREKRGTKSVSDERWGKERLRFEKRGLVHLSISHFSSLPPDLTLLENLQISTRGLSRLSLS